MAHAKRNEFAAELNRRLTLLRPKFVAALEAMDYELALNYQIEIDDLRRQRDTLHPTRKHFSLIHRATAAPMITRYSGRSKPAGW